MTIFFFLFCWWKRPRVSKSLQSKRFEARRKVSEWRLWCCFVVFDRHSNPENMDDNSITFLSLADVTNWLADHHAFFVCFLGCGCLFALCLFFALVVFSVVFFCFVSFFILASWQLTGLCTGPTSVQLLKSTIVKMDDVFALIDRICTGLQTWWSLGNHLNSSAGYFPQLGALWLCTSENLLSRSAAGRSWQCFADSACLDRIFLPFDLVRTSCPPSDELGEWRVLTGLFFFPTPLGFRQVV